VDCFVAEPATGLDPVAPRNDDRNPLRHVNAARRRARFALHSIRPARYISAMIFTILVLIILAGGAAFIWQQTKAKGRLGISWLRHNCPRCGTPLPMFRKPASASEAMWGGWTCPQCGCKIDKYGREIAAGPNA